MPINPIGPCLNLFKGQPGRFVRIPETQAALKEGKIQVEWGTAFQYAGTAGTSDPARPKPGHSTPSVPSRPEHVRATDNEGRPVEGISAKPEGLTGQLNSGHHRKPDRAPEIMALANSTEAGPSSRPAAKLPEAYPPGTTLGILTAQDRSKLVDSGPRRDLEVLSNLRENLGDVGMNEQLPKGPHGFIEPDANLRSANQTFLDTVRSNNAKGVRNPQGIPEQSAPPGLATQLGEFETLTRVRPGGTDQIHLSYMQGPSNPPPSDLLNAISSYRHHSHPYSDNTILRGVDASLQQSAPSAPDYIADAQRKMLSDLEGEGSKGRFFPAHKFVPQTSVLMHEERFLDFSGKTGQDGKYHGLTHREIVQSDESVARSLQPLPNPYGEKANDPSKYKPIELRPVSPAPPSPENT